MASSPITSWQIDREKVETLTDFIFLGCKITGDSDCSHEIKRCLLLGRKAMTNADSIWKSRDITLLTKIHIYSQSYGFSSSDVWMWDIHWKDWCWSWSSNSLATWCGELTHWKRPWCWERLKAGGEGNNRGWDGWMASPTQWTWVWVDSGSWWWIGRPGVLQFMESQRVGDNLATEQQEHQSKEII